jgi:hypothetical protein
MAFAERLVKDLNSAGADAWLDKTNLGPGNIAQRISAALDNCEWFLLLVTQNALESDWVGHEVDAAIILKNQGSIRNMIFIQAYPVDNTFDLSPEDGPGIMRNSRPGRTLLRTALASSHRGRCAAAPYCRSLATAQ